MITNMIRISSRIVVCLKRFSEKWHVSFILLTVGYCIVVPKQLTFNFCGYQLSSLLFITDSLSFENFGDPMYSRIVRTN